MPGIKANYLSLTIFECFTILVLRNTDFSGKWQDLTADYRLNSKHRKAPNYTNRRMNYPEAETSGITQRVSIGLRVTWYIVFLALDSQYIFGSPLDSHIAQLCLHKNHSSKNSRPITGL